MGVRVAEIAACAVCTPRRADLGRPPRLPADGMLACRPCREGLDGQLADVATLYTTLVNPPVTPDRQWTATICHNPDRVLAVPGYDPISGPLPAADVNGRRGGGRVSGSHDAPVPTSLDTLDLSGPVRPVDALTPAGRRHGEDQIGYLSVGSELYAWAVDLATHRRKGEAHPGDSVTGLVAWLRVRLDDTCRDYPDLPQFAAAVWWHRNTLMRVCGLVDVPDHKRGVPCPGCGQRKLLRVTGSDWVECSNCPEARSPEAYARWVGLQAEHHRQAARRAGMSLEAYGRMMRTPAETVDVETQPSQVDGRSILP